MRHALLGHFQNLPVSTEATSTVVQYAFPTLSWPHDRDSHLVRRTFSSGSHRSQVPSKSGLARIVVVAICAIPTGFPMGRDQLAPTAGRRHDRAMAVVGGTSQDLRWMVSVLAAFFVVSQLSCSSGGDAGPSLAS